MTCECLNLKWPFNMYITIVIMMNINYNDLLTDFNVYKTYFLSSTGVSTITMDSAVVITKPPEDILKSKKLWEEILEIKTQITKLQFRVEELNRDVSE